MRAVPRYPSNVYYNVSRQGQQLDEYNWIYVAPEAGGGCVPIDGVTTCRTAPATWDEYVTLETRVMFRHLTGNDPRPHFFHQSNLADYNPALPDVHADQGGILYPVIDALVGRYEAAFDRAAAPLVQLTHTQIADALARQDAWARDRAGVSAWVQDGRVYVHNAGAAPVDGAAHGHDRRRAVRDAAIRLGDGAGRDDRRVRAGRSGGRGAAGGDRDGTRRGDAASRPWARGPARRRSRRRAAGSAAPRAA